MTPFGNPPGEDLPKDSVYRSYIRALVQIDGESAATTPDINRIRLLRTTADADRVELVCMALKLSLMPQNEVDRLKASLLQAAESALQRITASARASITRNAQAHPRVAQQGLRANLESACRRAVAEVEAERDSLLAESSVENARAQRIRELLRNEVIAEHKHKAATPTA